MVPVVSSEFYPTPGATAKTFSTPFRREEKNRFAPSAPQRPTVMTAWLKVAVTTSSPVHLQRWPSSTSSVPALFAEEPRKLRRIIKSSQSVVDPSRPPRASHALASTSWPNTTTPKASSPSQRTPVGLTLLVEEARTQPHRRERRRRKSDRRSNAKPSAEDRRVISPPHRGASPEGVGKKGATGLAHTRASNGLPPRSSHIHRAATADCSCDHNEQHCATFEHHLATVPCPHCAGRSGTACIC
jgi:hypothetical protein